VVANCNFGRLHNIIYVALHNIILMSPKLYTSHILHVGITYLISRTYITTNDMYYELHPFTYTTNTHITYNILHITYYILEITNITCITHTYSTFHTTKMTYTHHQRSEIQADQSGCTRLYCIPYNAHIGYTSITNDILDISYITTDTYHYYY